MAVFGGAQGLVLAHRWSYEHHVGPIPEGLTVDHLCRNTSCVNPEHMEVVTREENAYRGSRNKDKTHCDKGHELTAANVYVARVVRPSAAAEPAALRPPPLATAVVVPHDPRHLPPRPRGPLLRLRLPPLAGLPVRHPSPRRSPSGGHLVGSP